jgi:exodeoxyribonuclease-5
MNLSQEQEAAAAAILAWLERYESGDTEKDVFVLTGYAGTGKTTLLGALGSSLGGSGNPPTYATPTGKAMNVLRKKLDVDPSAVRTLHNLLYTPATDPKYGQLLEKLRGAEKGSEEYEDLLKQYRVSKGEEVAFAVKEDAEADGRLIVVDEASMVSERILQDLRKLERPILLVGDDMQLPPVGGKSIFGTCGVDARLTEVHRQALDNPIITLATAIRNGDEATVEGWKRHRFNVDMALRADRVLCYKNTTRRHLNRQMRAAMGFQGETPVSGDRLICTRNARGYKWVNGAECSAAGDAIPDKGEQFWRLDIDYEGEIRPDVLTYVHDCVAHYRDCPELAVPWSEFPQQAQAVDYGYALTVHKSQGSEFDKVLLMDDAAWLSKKDAKQRQQWLYTAVTRAKEKLAWCA